MRNEYTVTKRLMKSWAKGWYFNYSIDKILLMLIFVCCYTPFILFTPYLFIHLFRFLSGVNVFEPAYPITILLFGPYHTMALLFIILILFVPRIAYVSQYITCCKNYSVESWQRSIELTDDEIVVTDYKSIFKYQYHTIRRVKERGNIVHIFLKSGTEIIIHKDAFVIGSWEECKSLISRKSSVKIK